MLRRVKLGVALVALVVAVACGGDSSPGSPTAAVPSPAPVPTPTAPTARYIVTFESVWRAETHPADFPSDPHFSRLISSAS